jgi:lysophospholipase L1-like esterase
MTSTPFRNAALAAASTLVFGGLIEGVARLIEPPPVQKEEYLWDWSERFKDGDFYTLEKGEGYPPSEETNVDGLRDATRPIETREGLTRVVILGDSVTYGHGIESSQAFPQVLERKLREDDRDVEVFNMGLPGWSTRQERIAYERIARKYKPDVVVLAVCLNDLAELQINLTKPPRFLPALFKRSATVRMALGASRREIGAVEELFTASESPRVENAFRLFFEEVRALLREVRKDGAEFHLVVAPFRFQLEAGAPPPTVQRRIAEFANAEKLPFTDLLPLILADSPAPTSLFLDYDHFTTSGHAWVAEWLAQEGIAQDDPDADPHPLFLPRSASGLLGDLTAPASVAHRERQLRWIRDQSPNLVSDGPAGEAIKSAVIALAVDDSSPRVRFEAAQALYALALPGEASVAALIRGLKHEDPRVRAFATWTLGEMREVAQPAVPALVALARDDGGAGKTGALTAIGKIGGNSPETIPLLLQELKHPKEARRYRAARTIGRMGEAAGSAVPGLIEALRDPSALVRLHVVRAFGNIGEASKSALPALIQVLNNDPDPEVRKEVSLTLSKLPGR